MDTGFSARGQGRTPHFRGLVTPRVLLFSDRGWQPGVVAAQAVGGVNAVVPEPEKEDDLASWPGMPFMEGGGEDEWEAWVDWGSEGVE